METEDYVIMVSVFQKIIKTHEACTIFEVISKQNKCKFFWLPNKMWAFRGLFISKSNFSKKAFQNEVIILFKFFKGCFAGGVYLALWFTVLQPELETQEKVLSVLALFPIVSILLIWLTRSVYYVRRQKSGHVNPFFSKISAVWRNS